MKWPWVSRRAFDMVTDERDRLRAQNESLIDALTRMQRFQMGMTEKPKENGRKMEPMPAPLKAHFDAIGNRSIRQHQMAEAYRRYAREGTWKGILDEIFGDGNEEAVS